MKSILREKLEKIMPQWFQWSSWFAAKKNIVKPTPLERPKKNNSPSSVPHARTWNRIKNQLSLKLSYLLVRSTWGHFSQLGNNSETIQCKSDFLLWRFGYSGEIFFFSIFFLNFCSCFWGSPCLATPRLLGIDSLLDWAGGNWNRHPVMESSFDSKKKIKLQRASGWFL